MPLESTAENFLQAVPTTVVENLEFRMKLHKTCATSKDAQAALIHLCRIKPQISFKTLFWTFDPRRKGGKRNLPFITWKMQEEVIDELVLGIRTGESRLIDKSRDEGATWLILGVFFNFFLFEPESYFLVSSRKEEFVDKKGDPKTLFAKTMHLHKYLPEWIRPQIEKTHLHIINQENGSVQDGESTNEDLGAGDRRLAVMVDEMGRMDPTIADSIADTLSDVTDCIIFNSTHSPRLGHAHPYAKLRFSGRVKVIVMPWYKDPRKTTGLYRSPDYNQVEIHDMAFYRNKYPSLFDKVNEKEVFDIRDVEISAAFHGEKHALFVPDGSGEWRSVWFDAQERTRSARNLAVNVKMCPLGATDTVFDLQSVQQMITDYCRPPDYEGEISYGLLKENRVISVKVQWEYGKKRFKWWGQLIEDSNGKLRPNQNHSYIIGTDISIGTGVSNSVHSIFDCNIQRKVGSWVCPYTSPIELAEIGEALSQWVGGATQGKCFMIWEENGAGAMYGRRLYQVGHLFAYIKKDEKIDYRPRGHRKGWHSTNETKQDLLYSYRESIALTFRQDTEDRRFINPDGDAMHEAEGYIFYPNGKSIGPAKLVQEEGGAVAAHGDRVIADALCNLARRDQLKAKRTLEKVMPVGSFGWRRQERRKKQEADKNVKWRA